MCARASGLHWMGDRGLVLLWIAEFVAMLDETSQHGMVELIAEIAFIFTGGTISQILGIITTRVAQSEGSRSDIIVRRRLARDRN